jgi:hypothetical protein
MNAKIIKCFVSSPSDTLKERNVCDKVLQELNQTIGTHFKIRFESIKWENDVTPGFGESAQEVINQRVGETYDIFIGIMHLRFGSPTKNAGSGTEEEFDIAFERFKNKDKLEILFYFNDEPPSKVSDIDTKQLEKVNSFKTKLSNLGGLYYQYNGVLQFEEKLRKHLSDYLLKHSDLPTSIIKSDDVINHRAGVKLILEKRLHDSLQIYSSQPIIWIEPILSPTNEISQNADDNFESKIDIDHLIDSPISTIIKAPPQFGLTCLAHQMIKRAYDKNLNWVYVDSSTSKAHSIDKSVKRELESLKITDSQLNCIVLDSWNNYESDSIKKVKALCNAFKSIPIIIMQTIDDSKFHLQQENETIEREFDVLHLLAMPRTQVRKVVSEYNKAKNIGDEDTLLAKLVSDLDVLNIHRTPHNVITLLKVSERHFDESPVNRTKMLEMVLFVLFDMDGIPTYKTKPDLKDCEYVLGRYCEKLIKSDFYEFSRETFLHELKSFCAEKLIELEVDVVFDVLKANSIIVKKDSNYIFRSSYWIFYFAAKRMHHEPDFAQYIFNSKKYISFPEIIEFYTGVDRSRKDALTILMIDIKETCDIVNLKVGISDEMNPYKLAQWNPSEAHVEKMQQEISEHVLNSNLPEEVKDRHADKSYNQLRPYNQTIQAILEHYSVHSLMQKIRASSRALRNSDYVDPEIKREMLTEIIRSWEQLTKVLLALTPILASKGNATFEGASFYLNGDFGETFEIRMNRILQCLHSNIVGLFKDDLYSHKLGPLIFDQFKTEKDDNKKHQLALLLIYERPKGWKSYIQDYIVSISKNSFYLFNTVNTLRTKYKYDFASKETLNEISYLIKMGLAKHEFGDKKPGMDKIVKISNNAIPKREYNDEDDVSGRIAQK